MENLPIRDVGKIMRVGKSKGGQVRVGNYVWPDMDSFLKTICQPFAPVFFLPSFS